MSRRAQGADAVHEHRRPTEPQPDQRAGLAIVPFQADHAHEDFARAATDDVIRAFGGLTTWLAVTVAGGAVIREPSDLRRLQQTSKARYMLRGAVETEGERLRLVVELTEVKTGRMLWSDRFHRRLSGYAGLREHAAACIARAVPPLLLQREVDRTTLLRPEELTAHDRALLAFSVVMQPRSGWLRDARALLSADGPPASTHFVWVWCHCMARNQGCSMDWAAATSSAGEMDRDDPAAMAVAGLLAVGANRDHGLALAMLDRVIDISPVLCPGLDVEKSDALPSGDGEAAVFHAERAQTMPVLGPERAWRDQVTALAHHVAGRYGDAVRWSRVSAMQHQGLAANARVLAASLAVLGLLDQAYRAACQVLVIDPAFRIGVWRKRSLLPEPSLRDMFAQRLRLAGLPA